MKNPDPNPEDEAFEELALKQGHWQHTSGWRKKQIMKTSTTQDEVDIMWQQAMRESIKNNEMYTRYHFAKLVAEAEREWLLSYIQEHQPSYEQIDNAIRARGQA